MATPEGLILKAICQYLSLQEKLGKCWYARSNNTSTYDPKLKKYRMANGPGYRYGVPDIIACINGHYVGIEVKSKTGVPSDHQEKFCEGLTKAGGIYVVARSVSDIEHLFHG